MTLAPLSGNSIDQLPTMTSISLFNSLCVAMALGITSLAAVAGPGHDHGDAPAGASGPTLPRFVAASDLFELVGVLQGKTLTLYLDRADDNSPVKNAQLELDIGGAKAVVTAVDDGTFATDLSALPAAGQIPVTATVLAGDDSDLLAAELDIHADEHAPQAPGLVSTSTIVGWGAAGMALLAALWGWGRARAARVGGAA
jgi:hypothetical protein